jgi:hypothetical protein
VFLKGCIASDTGQGRLHRSRLKLYLLISPAHNKAAKKLKTNGAYTESTGTDLIFKTLKKIIHLVAQFL